jgi:hypothetical protein
MPDMRPDFALGQVKFRAIEATIERLRDAAQKPAV